jgi:hypothetical protein
LLLFAELSSDTVTVIEVEHRVDSALPLGSSRQEIEAWLTDQGFVCSYEVLPVIDTTLAKRVPDMDRYHGVITSIIRDTDRSFFVTGNILLYFLLDSQGKLARREVIWIGTGP